MSKTTPATKIDLNSLVAEIQELNNEKLDEYTAKKERWMNLVSQLKHQIETLCRAGDDYKVSYVNPKYPILPEFRRNIHLPSIEDGRLVLDYYHYSAPYTHNVYQKDSWTPTGEKITDPESLSHSSEYSGRDLFSEPHDLRIVLRREVIEVLLKEILAEVKTLNKYRLNTLTEIKQSVEKITELGMVE